MAPSGCGAASGLVPGAGRVTPGAEGTGTVGAAAGKLGRESVTRGAAAVWGTAWMKSSARVGSSGAVPGSTGAGTTPGRIYPGKRMAGRYGGKKTTTRGLTILKVDSDRNLLVVKGSVPGKPGALLNIRPANRVGAKPAKGGK